MFSIYSVGVSSSFVESVSRLLFYWAEKYFQALQESVFFVLIAIFSQPNEKANCAVYISLPGLCCITQHPLLSNLGSPLGFISVFKINAAGGLSKSDTFFSQIENRLLFKHQHLNASPYGFAGVYRQCRCVITVCTRKSPACHKVCNFNKIYCPFFRCNINKDNVHKSIISWSRSVHEKRCIGVSIKLNIYRKCWEISNINEDLTILCRTRQYRVLYLPIDHQHRFLPRQKHTFCTNIVRCVHFYSRQNQIFLRQ